jgi:hypothetical protein
VKLKNKAQSLVSEVRKRFFVERKGVFTFDE